MTRPHVMSALAALMFASTVMGAEAQAPPAQTKPPAAQATKPQQAPPTAVQAPKPQPPAAAQAPKPQAVAPAAAPVAARGSILIMVTDGVGAALPDVEVAMTGPVSRDGATSRDGSLRLQALKPGTYRLRFESPDFITLEREVVVKAGPPAEVDVTLDRAPPVPAAAVPPPAPAPAQPPSRGSAAAPLDPNATVDLIPLPDWIEKNLIGRSDPQKETVVGRAMVTTASVVQVRDPIKERGRADADEMLYVIAGEGILRAKGREQVLDAGSFVVVPRGVSYSLERRGRNPLIALSIVGR